MNALCPKCNTFFGNHITLGLCSSCHKEHLKTQAVLSEASKFSLPETTHERQLDHSKCFTCRKKIGLLGVRCTGCACSYCNAHRLKEQHSCDGAFLPAQKKDAKNLPISMVPSKIEKI
jgi:hypothetical protein